MSLERPRHIPVLLREVVDALGLKPGASIVDATFGAGGYSRAILDAHDNVQVLALDRDETAVAAAAAMVTHYAGRLAVVLAPFSDLEEVARSPASATAGDKPATFAAPATFATPANFSAPDGIVLDIGVSSMQIDTAERGFSFMADGPLDMRMGRTGPTAADFINSADEADIADVLFQFGEERRSRAIARAIVRVRKSSPIATTRALATIVEKTLGRARGDEKHPATRTFQALRIHINDELGELASALHGAERLLPSGGRLVVVTFHSLEDRIVKRFLARRSRPQSPGSRHGPPGLSIKVFEPSFRIVNRAPVTASADELATNPRARSAKLRAAERTAAAAFTPDDLAELGIPGGAGVPGRPGRR